MRKIFFILTILAIVSFSWARPRVDNAKYLDVAKKVLKNENVKIYESVAGRICVYSADSVAVAGVFILTTETREVRGYSGESIIGIEVDLEGKIIQARLLKSPDTKSFISKIKRAKYFEKLIGVTAKTKKVMNVSGASVSMRAWTKAVQHLLTDFAPVLAQLKATGTKSLKVIK